MRSVVWLFTIYDRISQMAINFTEILLLSHP